MAVCIRFYPCQREAFWWKIRRGGDVGDIVVFGKRSILVFISILVLLVDDGEVKEEEEVEKTRRKCVQMNELFKFNELFDTWI
jgi:hypothetical protein